MGTADGSRLFWEVTGDRTLRIYGEPVPWRQAGDPRRRRVAARMQVGRRWPGGELPVGRHLLVEDAPEALGLWPIMLDGAEYDAVQGTVQLYPQEDAGHVPAAWRA